MTAVIDPKTERNNKLFGAVGAVVEWYDLMLYGYLSVVFARIFFPDDVGAGVALAATLGGFAIGFLMRPIGGIFFGWLGDHSGRKVSLTLAITMMSVPMLGTALLPTYDSIGWLAPILLIVFRMVQGFSSGGEYSGTLVFLTEGANTGRRGRTVAIATTYAGVGILLAALVTAIIGSLTTDAQMDSWGWRLPYLFGSLIIIVGIFMRMKMQETARYEEIKTAGKISKTPIRDSLRYDWRAILRIVLLTGYGGITYFIVLTYLVSYLENTVGISHDAALWIGTGSAAMYALTAHFFGVLADRVGRRPPMLWSAVAFVLLPVPMFMLLNTGNMAWISVASIILLIPVMAYVGALAVACTELFPTSHRNAGVGIGYNFGSALIGSTAPFIAQVLVAVTGAPSVPAWYLVIASLIAIPIIYKLPETAFVKLADFREGQ